MTAKSMLLRLQGLRPRARAPTGCMLSALPNQPLIKEREAYWCYFSVLVFPLALSGNFSADALDQVYPSC